MSGSLGRPGCARVGRAQRTVGMNGSTTTVAERRRRAPTQASSTKPSPADVEQGVGPEPAHVPGRLRAQGLGGPQAGGGEHVGGGEVDERAAGRARGTPTAARCRPTRRWAGRRGGRRPRAAAMSRTSWSSQAERAASVAGSPASVGAAVGEGDGDGAVVARAAGGLEELGPPLGRQHLALGRVDHRPPAVALGALLGRGRAPRPGCPAWTSPGSATARRRCRPPRAPRSRSWPDRRRPPPGRGGRERRVRGDRGAVAGGQPVRRPGLGLDAGGVGRLVVDDDVGRSPRRRSTP